jgi:ribosome maturation factor RimP
MNELVRRAWRALEPCLAEQGYELVEVEYARQGGSPLLRLYIDKAGGGITLDDCTAVSELLGPVLDAGDFISEHYLLEVSSPGIDRPLRKTADFERFAGEEIRLVAEAPSEGRKRFTGILRGIKDGSIEVECEGHGYQIHIENLKKANLNR